MLRIETIPTKLFGANCYLVGAEGVESVVVVDPGVGVADQIAETLLARGQRVGAVVLTHGHGDHVWQADAVSRVGNDAPAPVFIPGPDLQWLDDPAGPLGLSSHDVGLADWVRPQIVEEVPSGAWQPVPDIYLQMIPAPGHSAGSAIFLLGDSAQVDGRSVELVGFSGDVVFAGSVGRTDLPGGHEGEMRQSLRTLVNVMNPQTVLLPGHGPTTVWADECQSNPYVLRAKRLG